MKRSESLQPSWARDGGRIGWRALGLVAAGVVMALLAWAANSRIQETATARGLVISKARNQSVQTIDGGALEVLAVQEGQLVHQGDLLAQLDKRRLMASFAECQGRTMALRAMLARLQAEALNRRPVFGKELQHWPDLIDNQLALMARRRAALGDATAALEQSLAAIKAELAITQPLERSGDVGHVEILRLVRQQADVTGQIANLRNKFLQDVQAELAKTAEELTSQERVLEERQALVDHAELRAPSEGLVKNVAVTTLGAVLRPGDTLMELVPVGEALIVEAKLAPSDIAFVQAGAAASVKFDAYDYTTYGQAEGVVSYVSPDALTETDPRLGERMYYRIHVRIDRLPPNAVHGRTLQLQPGMAAQVDVSTGERTVLQYLFKPIMLV
jgi:multidrug efflux pump subunit AcrA (membrane-fusion protein)